VPHSARQLSRCLGPYCSLAQARSPECAGRQAKVRVQGNHRHIPVSSSSALQHPHQAHLSSLTKQQHYRHVLASLPNPAVCRCSYRRRGGADGAGGVPAGKASHSVENSAKKNAVLSLCSLDLSAPTPLHSASRDKENMLVSLTRTLRESDLVSFALAFPHFSCFSTSAWRAFHPTRDPCPTSVCLPTLSPTLAMSSTPSILPSPPPLLRQLPLDRLRSEHPQQDP
jgi:hypothetical protein